MRLAAVSVVADAPFRRCLADMYFWKLAEWPVDEIRTDGLERPHGTKETVSEPIRADPSERDG